MRQGRVAIAVTALAAAALAGCADRPNDLNTYYDDGAPAGPPSASNTAAAGSTESTETTADPPETPDAPADPTRLGASVSAAVLTDEDVAAEGVRPAPAVASADGCLAAIPLGLVSQQRRDSRWEYATGSTLEQRVTGYPDHSAADVLDGRVRCAGEPIPVAVEPPVDAHAAWCADTTCTVLLAQGRVLSGVQVNAGERERAAEAVRRLAPVAAARLSVQP
ncbi:hypothetical protein [Qaidamihabitans albus]|uniref:hypothetical protein n=1 Tax=Qaidamihabitans albus TaxID=2795733 RepID=UPI0027DC9E55|nr:hypothetical protein [Qaidamihabitans albus]